ncbi:MAG: ribonuclease Z [Candidatus Methanomethylophilaceae archaeon]|nr:ribonuclease Z [Candidatus Methanomethylophilaceae archaeon]
MVLDITFLGTGAGVPSKNRGMSAVAVRSGSRITLFDCAEGTQRQFMLSRLSFMKVEYIFITHLHGDHMLGLPGLLQTMGMSGRSAPLTVYGPEGICDAVSALLSSCDGILEYDLTVTELHAGDTVPVGTGSVTAFSTVHGVTSLGYRYSEADVPGAFDKAKAISLGISPGPDFGRLQRGETVNGVTPEMVMEPVRKGISVVYTGDTKKCASVISASMGADVMIHDSTYDEGMEARADEHMHSTCVQAAESARDASVGHLILTHFSHRYEDCTVLRDHARRVFPETYVANDFDCFEVTRSGIRLV